MDLLSESGINYDAEAVGGNCLGINVYYYFYYYYEFDYIYYNYYYYCVYYYNDYLETISDNCAYITCSLITRLSEGEKDGLIFLFNRPLIIRELNGDEEKDLVFEY